MKKMIFIISCFLLFACKSYRTTLSPFVAIYKSDGGGSIYPRYIFLKMQPKSFEIYSPGIYSSTVGQWNINNDTLFLFPEYEYYTKDSELKVLKITFRDTSVTTIPQQYLIKNDCLIDITDYSTILLDLFSKSNKAVYRRVKKQ